jgi:hypothetical protein
MDMKLAVAVVPVSDVDRAKNVCQELGRLPQDITTRLPGRIAPDGCADDKDPS